MEDYTWAEKQELEIFNNLFFFSTLNVALKPQQLILFPNTMLLDHQTTPPLYPAEAAPQKSQSAQLGKE